MANPIWSEIGSWMQGLGRKRVGVLLLMILIATSDKSGRFLVTTTGSKGYGAFVDK